MDKARLSKQIHDVGLSIRLEACDTQPNRKSIHYSLYSPEGILPTRIPSWEPGHWASICTLEGIRKHTLTVRRMVVVRCRGTQNIIYVRYYHERDSLTGLIESTRGEVTSTERRTLVAPATTPVRIAAIATIFDKGR